MTPQTRNVGCLYVVATPIGNLEDITLRAMRILTDVSIIACENVVRTKSLLHSLRIEAKNKQFIVLNNANEDRATEQVLAILSTVQDVVIVSDAGTPLISDPGYRLIREAHSSRILTVPVPGPNAVMTLASVCPIPLHEFRFIGFLAKKGKKRTTQLAQFQLAAAPTIVFESSRRVMQFIKELVDLDLGDRKVFLGREMTKLYEEYVYTTVLGLYDELSNRANLKGELVLVIDGSKHPQSAWSSERLLDVLLPHLKPAQLATILTVLTQLTRDQAYARIVSRVERASRGGFRQDS